MDTLPLSPQPAERPSLASPPFFAPAPSCRMATGSGLSKQWQLYYLSDFSHNPQSRSTAASFHPTCCLIAPVSQPQAATGGPLLIKETGTREGKEEKKKKNILVRFPDTLPHGPQPAERPSFAMPRDVTGLSLVDGSILLCLLVDGMAPPGSTASANGSDSFATFRVVATPAQSRSTAVSSPSHLLLNRSSTTASGSQWWLLLHLLVPHLLSTLILLSSEGSPVVSLHPLGFRHQCNKV